MRVLLKAKCAEFLFDNVQRDVKRPVFSNRDIYSICRVNAKNLRDINLQRLFARVMIDFAA